MSSVSAGQNAKLNSVNPQGVYRNVCAVYPELRRIARGLLSRERRSHTLQATALANEVVMRLLRRERQEESDPKTLVEHGIREMKTILIDYGRRYQSRIRSLDRSQAGDSAVESILPLMELTDCLEKLGRIDARAQQVVELRYLVGLTVEETAEYLGVCNRTVNEDWQFARAWLFGMMRDS